ncbi:hypothetical protein [Anaerococcus obesiensis]|uniref:hypothetical protein n=1 Tax=Anaerococcus obesiensis TaxID=1287640 RepID=UPI0002DEB141
MCLVIVFNDGKREMFLVESYLVFIEKGTIEFCEGLTCIRIAKLSEIKYWFAYYKI